jgi:hypothetical protein
MKLFDHSADRLADRTALLLTADPGDALLVRGLAERLGGTTRPATLQPQLALLASVYSERAPAVGQVIDVLRPYAGELTAEDVKEDSYSLSGKKISCYTAYWSPRPYIEREAPAALGPARSRRQHHWDLHAGVRASHAAPELCRKAGAAALALASESAGIALDMLGFIINSAEDLVPRSRLPGEAGPDLLPR